MYLVTFTFYSLLNVDHILSTGFQNTPITRNAASGFSLSWVAITHTQSSSKPHSSWGVIYALSSELWPNLSCVIIDSRLSSDQIVNLGFVFYRAIFIALYSYFFRVQNAHIPSRYNDNCGRCFVNFGFVFFCAMLIVVVSSTVSPGRTYKFTATLAHLGLVLLYDVCLHRG